MSVRIPVRAAGVALAAFALAMAVGSCSGSDEPDQTTQPRPSAEAQSDGAATDASSPDTAPARTDAERTEETMQIRITIGDQQFAATLEDSAAARDLVAQLPVTVDMTDHGGVEKTGRLPSPLSLDGQPEGADPDVGDLGYYAPGNDLVLYYGDQSYFPGIVVLGRLEGDAAERIAELDGSVSATVESG